MRAIITKIEQLSIHYYNIFIRLERTQSVSLYPGTHAMLISFPAHIIPQNLCLWPFEKNKNSPNVILALAECYTCKPVEVGAVLIDQQAGWLG